MLVVKENRNVPDAGTRRNRWLPLNPAASLAQDRDCRPNAAITDFGCLPNPGDLSARAT
jgi:hypothetical protein